MVRGNRRVALNVMVTYGRSLYALLLGLFSARWLLLSLGEVDYGLFGVIGGMVAFVSFLNSIMSSGVSRFYAYSVGAAQKSQTADTRNVCIRWFNIALFVHTILPIGLMLIGYPVGEWAVKNYLTIPTERIESCVWVWRFVCVGCFVSMVSVPFQAMYNAKQEIAELTLYSFASTTLNFFLLFYMINHPGDWLVRYAFWSLLWSIAPSAIICCRAVMKYPECRFVARYLWDRKMLVELLEFAGGRFLCGLSLMLSNQGVSVVINKLLGPTRNATMSLSNSVSGHTLSLSSAINTAFQPVITQAAGSRDYEKMRKSMLVTCTISTLALLIFMLPLFLEAESVFKLWLKCPPRHVAILCVLMLLGNCFCRATDGLWMGILAMGDCNRFQITEAIILVFMIPIMLVFVCLGCDVISVALAYFCVVVADDVCKLYFARSKCGFSTKKWISKGCVPLVIISIVSLMVGSIPRILLAEGLGRIVLTTGAVEAVIFIAAWFFLLPMDVKNGIKKKFKHKGLSVENGYA